jgi:hypothetical protein
MYLGEGEIFMQSAGFLGKIVNKFIGSRRAQMSTA